MLKTTRAAGKILRRCEGRQALFHSGGGVVGENVHNFALKQGMYVTLQSGDNVEIIPPEGKSRTW